VTFDVFDEVNRSTTQCEDARGRRPPLPVVMGGGTRAVAGLGLALLLAPGRSALSLEKVSELPFGERSIPQRQAFSAGSAAGLVQNDRDQFVVVWLKAPADSHFTQLFKALAGKFQKCLGD
jgi:hypothetical protein